MFFDPLYLVFALPGLLLGLWARSRVNGAFNKYKQVRTAQNVTGAEVARTLLDAQGLNNVRIEEVQGFLSDHYDPRSKVLRLSPEVYRVPSVASAGIAAHELGHALQDAGGYFPLQIRSAIVPVALWQLPCSLDLYCWFFVELYNISLGRPHSFWRLCGFHPGHTAGRIRCQPQSQEASDHKWRVDRE